jgi:D-alanyl-D-alanine carboxypeptidase
MKFLKKDLSKLRFILIATVAALTVAVGGTLIMQLSFPNPSVQSLGKSPSSLVCPQQNSSSPVPATSGTPTDSTVAKVNPELTQPVPISSRTAYGHLPYAQAEPNRVMIIASYATGEDQRFEWLAPEAGKALMKMIYAARDEGVWLIPASGFRTIEQQQKLFQEQIKRRGSIEAAAKISAPPGYSEHHTGFAVDLADGHFPKQDIKYQFENTDAYRWLTRRAKEFSFELSFPSNNPQGVSYEPWHWRYVASPDAATIFAKARSLQ